MTGTGHTHNTLIGDLSKLRAAVDKKFVGLDKPVKKRFITKKADILNVYGKFTKSNAAKIRLLQPGVLKRPAAIGSVVQTFEQTNDWTVTCHQRQTGIHVGKEYKTYTSPDGKMFASLTRAKQAGYTVS